MDALRVGGWRAYMESAYYYYYFIYHLHTNEFRDAMPMLIHFHVSTLFLLQPQRPACKSERSQELRRRSEVRRSTQKIELKNERNNKKKKNSKTRINKAMASERHRKCVCRIGASFVRQKIPILEMAFMCFVFAILCLPSHSAVAAVGGYFCSFVGFFSRANTYRYVSA